MSQENVEIARGVHDAFNRRDVAALLELLDPQVEWVPILAELEGRVLPRPRRRPAVDQRPRHRLGVLRGRCPEEFRDLGDPKCSLLAAGVPAGERAGSSWITNPAAGSSISRTKVLRQQTYTDRADAFEAIKLRVARSAARAAKYPHIPCTPPPGGVDDEQM